MALATDRGMPTGIPSFLGAALNKFIDHAKSQKALDDNEVCGLFLFKVSDWIPGTGWTGEIVYKAVPNLSATTGGFEMDPSSSIMFMSEMIEERERVATAVCERYGWDENTPWTVAMSMDVNAQLDAMVADSIQVGVDFRAEHINNALREEMMDLCQGFLPYAHGLLSTDSAEGVERLSAHTWLMIRGVSVLSGIGHSHPNGDPSLSPEDFLANKVVDTWKQVFQARYATEGQKSGSALELPKSVGNWIYGLPQDREILISGQTGNAVRTVLVGHSSLSRYDARGLRGVWTGPF